MPDFDGNQRLGLEVECADVLLNMGGTVGDTYGITVMETQETHAATGLPWFSIVLEERKERENPKIEVTTAPLTISTAGLAKHKKYINAVVDLAGGKTAAEWVTAAKRVRNTLTNKTYTWKVSANYPLTYHAKKFTKKNAGARVPQCNVDLYLRQFYTAPDLIKTMINDAPRQTMYTASRTCANTWATSAHFNAVADRDDIKGLLTLALYTALCEKRFGGAPNSLGKDRTQPLPKAGVDDLARLVLPNADQAGLVACITQVVGSARGQPASLRTLSSSLSLNSQPSDDATENLKTGYLARWFLEPRMRYTIDTDPVKINTRMKETLLYNQRSLEGETPRSGVQGLFNHAWDTHAGGAVTALGDKVWWKCDGEPGATPTGKPIFPKLVGGHPLFVIEVRNSKSKFCKKYYGDL